MGILNRKDLWSGTLLKWITRKHVHVDRIASPWLIKKFIDPEAEFNFVPWPGTELKPEDGIPIDIPGVELGHHNNKCTFETLIEKYNLFEKDPVLKDMAKIIHGADVAEDMAKIPEAAGLEVISGGMIWISKDDHEALEKGFLLYDALYTNLKVRQLRKKHQSQLENMSRNEAIEFLRKQLKNQSSE